MADSETGDRTLAPSERRLQKARDDGQLPISRELPALAGLAAAALVLTLGGPAMMAGFGRALVEMLATPDIAPGLALQRAAMAGLAVAGPIVAAVALLGTMGILLQTNALLHVGALLPDLSRLDPRRGLARIFGLNNAVEALKAIAKLVILVWALWSAMRTAWPGLAISILWTPTTLFTRLGHELTHILLVVVGCQAAIAILDVGWMRWRFSQRLRMSREDLRQETREADGDPRIKARIRQLRLARARRRMLAAVARATVVVTNPTHYAVALAYERGTQAAPRVVAKGMDDVAARIRATAEKAGVPLVANPPLARALHAVTLDAEVPAEHFRAVAEIIAYVWRLQGRARP